MNYMASKLFKSSSPNAQASSVSTPTYNILLIRALGKLQPFVEDIQSNYKLTVQLTGRITRAEAARAEAKQLGVKTREVCEQKIKALRAQQLEADRLNSHCQEREVSVEKKNTANLRLVSEPRLGLSETAFITGRVHHFRAIYLAEEINTQRAVHDRGTNQRCRVIVAPVERDVTMATMETFTLSFTIHIS